MIDIEAVTTCVNYSDFLEVTARMNRHLFSRWVVVTVPWDKATRDVCRKYNLDCVVTEDFGVKDFNKAYGVNKGLDSLSQDAWHLHIDADIVLPRNFLKLLHLADLDENKLYGCDRVLVKSADQWKAMRDFLLHDYHYRVDPPGGLPIGTRFCSAHWGYLPIGYFQLWHPKVSEYGGVRHRRYPVRHSGAARTDVQFAIQWDRKHRVLIPEVFCVHLESKPCELGINWHGRKSPTFYCDDAEHIAHDTPE